VTERVVSPTELDLRRIHAPEVPLERVFSPAQVQQADDLKLLGDVGFSGRLLKKDDRFRLVGRIRATLELACSRCLEPFPMPVDLEVDLTYLPQAALEPPVPAADEEVELGAEDLTTAFYRDDMLDLAHMLREQFYLALPMRPLCREDCQGLCPQCGTNLNVDRCECTREWRDPRLAVLRTLIEKEHG